MKKIIEIRKYLAFKFDDECLADEIFSFFVEMWCGFENFASYPFMIGFPGLVVRVNNDWKTQLEYCLSIKLICNLNAFFSFLTYFYPNLRQNPVVLQIVKYRIIFSYL